MHTAQDTPTSRLGRTASLVAAAGATAAAITIALEVFTDPIDNVDRYHRGLALPVNLALFLGVVVFALGMTGVLLAQRDSLGRTGFTGGIAVVIGLALGDLPHSVIDFAVAPQLFSHLPHDQAKSLLENHINNVIGLLSMVAILLILVGLITLGRASLRAGTLPRWASLALIGAIPGAIVLGLLSSASGLVPHPPVALYLGLAVYALGTRHVAGR